MIVYIHRFTILNHPLCRLETLSPRSYGFTLCIHRRYFPFHMLDFKMKKTPHTIAGMGV
jgi:hypothetical protein